MQTAIAESTDQRSIITRNVRQYRQTHRKHITPTEIESRRDRYWKLQMDIRRGRMASVYEAWPEGK